LKLFLEMMLRSDCDDDNESTIGEAVDFKEYPLTMPLEFNGFMLICSYINYCYG